MPLFAFILVIFSTFIHAAWNALGKDVQEGRTFFTYMLLCTSLIGLPFFIVSCFFAPFSFKALVLPFMSGFFVGAYFLALDMGYRSGDLSLVYPVARLAPLFVPLWAALFLGERISIPGGIGIIITLLGVYIIPIEKGSGKFKAFIRSPAVGFALLTALFSSGYSVIDKAGIRNIHPYQYVYLQYCSGLLIMILFIVLSGDRRTLFHVDRRILWKSLWAGVGSCVAYGIVLFALQWSKISYVAAVRQFCIIPGIFLGVIFFKERLGIYRILGAAIIFLGTILLGFAG